MAEATPGAYAHALRREILRSEQKRMRALAIVLAVLLVRHVDGRDVLPDLQPAHVSATASTVDAAGRQSARSSLFELMALTVLSWRIAARTRTSRSSARFANALIETSMPGVIIFVLARHMDAAARVRLLAAACSISCSSCCRPCGSISGCRCGPAPWPPSQQFGAGRAPAADRLRRPTGRRRRLIYHFSRSVMLMLAGVAAAIVARTLRQQFENSVAAAAARDRVTNLFGQHVSPVVVEQLLDAELASEKRTVCVMFLDIRGFTAMTRTRSADETVALLNDFFAEMIEIVDRNHGFINKFLGDGFLALFGAALADPSGGGQRAERRATPCLPRSTTGTAAIPGGR